MIDALSDLWPYYLRRLKAFLEEKGRFPLTAESARLWDQARKDAETDG